MNLPVRFDEVSTNEQSEDNYCGLVFDSIFSETNFKRCQFQILSVKAILFVTPSLMYTHVI